MRISKIGHVFAAIALLAAPLYAQLNAFDPLHFTTGLFRNCPPQGLGGDPALNELKNRDLPPPEFIHHTVAQILDDLPQDLPVWGKRSTWDTSDTREAARWESHGAAVEGYLLEIKQQGPEACNCRSDSERDIHLWLGAHAQDARSGAIVVEISPRLLPRHDSWTLKRIGRLVRQGSRVRISGWLMWDQEHPDQLQKTRATLWEIHPIHKIEVFTAGRWREL